MSRKADENPALQFHKWYANSPLGKIERIPVPDDPIVKEAIQNVRGRYSLSEWAVLPPQEVTAQIYREMRRLDLIATGRQPALAAPERAA